MLNDSAGSIQTTRGVDCRALLDTGADGISVTRTLADAAGLSYRGKTQASGLAGQNYHRSWTAYIGLYSESLGLLPFMLEEPFLAIEVAAYPAFDMIIGREALMLGDFTLKSTGEFEWRLLT